MSFFSRYLKDLDEELLKELDLVCHENQLACYPVSRTRNSENYILEEYPEIVSSVEADKQRRIDAMALQSRLSQIEPYEGRSRPSTGEKANPPSARKAKASAPRDSPSYAGSPMLKPRQSASDLMFQMDEEAALSPGDPTKGKAAMRGSRPGESIFANRSYPDSPALGASIPEGESLGDWISLDEQVFSPRDTMLESPSGPHAIPMRPNRAVASPPDSGLAPWGSPVISNSKKDLNDIMTETSQSRVSNLTLGMAGPRESSSGGNFSSKMSQKERKKLQQQQMQEKLVLQQKPKEAPRNPWQLPAAAAPATPAKPDPLPGQTGPRSPRSEPAKAPQKPAMTLRQTVAGTPPPQTKPEPTPVQTQRPSDSGNAQPSSLPKASTSGPSPNNAFPQPTIQSIRHIPRPDPYQYPNSSSLSLATILMQQQTEKDEIREKATAKHNLQDIQAEQEFQEWWEQESRRVQGLVSESNPQRSGKGGGRGGSRKRRGNKPAEPVAPGAAPAPATPTKNIAHVPAQSPKTPSGTINSAHGGRHGNQRGRGRDRG